MIHKGRNPFFPYIFLIPYSNTHGGAVWELLQIFLICTALLQNCAVFNLPFSLWSALNYIFTSVSTSEKVLFPSWHCYVNKREEIDCRWNALNLLEKTRFPQVCQWLVLLLKAPSFLPPVDGCGQVHTNAAVWPWAPLDAKIPLKL